MWLPQNLPLTGTPTGLSEFITRTVKSDATMGLTSFITDQLPTATTSNVPTSTGIHNIPTTINLDEEGEDPSRSLAIGLGGAGALVLALLLIWLGFWIYGKRKTRARGLDAQDEARRRPEQQRQQENEEQRQTNDQNALQLQTTRPERVVARESIELQEFIDISLSRTATRASGSEIGAADAVLGSAVSLVDITNLPSTANIDRSLPRPPVNDSSTQTPDSGDFSSQARGSGISLPHRPYTWEQSHRTTWYSLGSEWNGSDTPDAVPDHALVPHANTRQSTQSEAASEANHNAARGSVTGASETAAMSASDVEQIHEQLGASLGSVAHSDNGTSAPPTTPNNAKRISGASAASAATNWSDLEWLPSGKYQA